MRKGLFLLTGLALLSSTVPFVVGQSQADPNQVTAAAGPWLICVASYTGPDAAAMAHAFVEEIHAKYKMPAYFINRGADERRKQQDEIEKLRAKCPEGRFRTIHIEEQFAVLVGGYKDMETARKDLDRIKRLPAPGDKFCILGDRVVPGKSEKGEQGVWVQQLRISPFSNAFVARNPTAPPEQTVDKGDAAFLKEINSGESFSIYKCRKPWTLAVAVFQAPPTIHSGTSSSFLDKLTGHSGAEQLTASALNAHNLAEVFTKLGFESYVFHTRNNSVVTMGGYDSRDDPRMAQVDAALKRYVQVNPEQVKLLAHPLPVEVPH